MGDGRRETDAPPPGAKLRKDGEAKQSGLRQGEKKGKPYTLYFKLEVVRALRANQRLEKLSLTPKAWLGSGRVTSEMFNGLSEANISRWAKQEAALHESLVHENCVSRKHGLKKKHVGQVVEPKLRSRGARRTTLHRGRAPAYAALQVELHKLYRVRRLAGKRTSGFWLRKKMKILVCVHASDDAAKSFKASTFWLRGWARRFGVSLRRKSNNRSESLELRLPRIKRWHARLRRRLRGGPPQKLHPKWGRWLPHNRLAHDQVPMNLRCGDLRTYDDTGTARVWLAGSKADDGKRFCTLAITARCSNGDASKPRCGQPPLTILFRGQGKVISQKERDGWHPDVRVRFQPKAWADDELCEDVAAVEMFEATAEARAAGERSMCFFDNLSGQTTAEHLSNLRRAHCDRHLLPTGSTGELMLIDGGIGAIIKNLIGEEQDEWIQDDTNLERWTNGPKEGGLRAWEKRVLVTQWAGKAWDTMCKTCVSRTSSQASRASPHSPPRSSPQLATLPQLTRRAHPSPHCAHPGTASRLQRAALVS